MLKDTMISIIIPYRDRENHLKRFLTYTQRFLERSKLTAEIIVVEQSGKEPFNRGKLLNVGFKQAKYDTVIMQDVDMLPDYASYRPRCGATHLAGKASQFGRKMPFKEYFGGVTMFDKDSFISANGFPNNYWGWGAEDDEILRRCKSENIEIRWMPFRFTSLPHAHNKVEETHKKNLILFDAKECYKNNGLTTLEYKIIGHSEYIKSPTLTVHYFMAEI